MSRIYSFDEYVKESYNFTVKESINETIDSFVWAGVFESSYFNKDEKQFLKNFLIENSIQNPILNEAFIDNIKSSLKKAKEKGIEIAQKIGSETMDKLSGLAQNAEKFKEYLIGKIKELWNHGLEYYQKLKGEHKEKIKDSILKQKDKIGKPIGKALKEDIKNLKETLSWWKDNFISVVINGLKDKLGNILTKESLNWKGELILELAEYNDEILLEKEEKFGWLSKIVHTLAKYPPFSFLGIIREKATKSFGSFLKYISDFTKRLGGPGVYNFSALALLLGAVLEFTAKKAGIGAAIHVIPFASPVLSIASYVAVGLLVIEVIEELIEAGELAGII